MKIQTGRKAEASRTEITPQNPSGILDIIITPDEAQARPLFMLGSGGMERELAFLPDLSDSESSTFDPQKHIPVLLGSGTGPALRALVKVMSDVLGADFSIGVVDKENDILELTKLKEEFASFPGVVWFGAESAQITSTEISKWQEKLGGKAFFPVSNPFYLRLDRDYYKSIAELLSASAIWNFWEKSAYTKFKDNEARILLITSKYFLIGEIVAACTRLGIPYYLLELPEGECMQEDFVKNLLSAVISFKPDFVFTINHLGVDREGVLADLLARLRLPMASWFVDNPHLVLYLYSQLVNPWTAIFSWDSDNLPSLKKLGFEHVFHLPLGVDHTRFVPPANIGNLKSVFSDWQSKVSFVGNSMRYKIDTRMAKIHQNVRLFSDYTGLAADFGASEARSVSDWLKVAEPVRYNEFCALDSNEARLDYETMLTWEATRQYRLSCVKAMLPYSPLFVGDSGWLKELEGHEGEWRYHKELAYYTDLPNFYPLSDINFNCTSKQMKGAVNQRVFDVPAVGAFLLTDWREQIADLFEPGREVICYHSPEEATDLADYYLRHPRERKIVATSARARILSEHIYEKRILKMIEQMRASFF